MNTATEVVVPRMQALQKLEKTLKKLDLSWKVIETTARVVSPPESAGYIATLEHTRLAFSRLATEMVEQIARSHLENCLHDLAARAQVAIDILVRNLFERTADVGFIATDGPLLQYAQAPQEGAQEALRSRLAAYRAKYTVYDDILVLDSAARVLLALQPHAAADKPAPGWWYQAQAAAGYVECFGPSNHYPGPADVLLYAHRIVTPGGAACGAVVLKFDLASELASIFAALADGHTVLLMLDAQKRVVACSKPELFAPRQSLQWPVGAAQAVPTLRHGGVDYLFAHCSTRGYQGYQGPGWTTAALVRLDQAFAARADSHDGQAPGSAPNRDNGIELDNPQLRQIVARARGIEEDLNRVIWNGKLTDSNTRSGSALRPLFSEVGRTSQQTIAVFDDAIGELKSLLLQGRRAELAAHATLAVDIMDRNLYERANDCRWWALSEELADVLRTLDAGPDEAATAQAGAILAHLNSLYTVYRRVALFDRQGRILAVSRDAHSLASDAHIPAELLRRTLALKDAQAYAVSDMLPHALADGAASYLYCAPIRQAGSDRTLGGIALAFNCQDELQAMLKDALPGGPGVQGFLINPAGVVLSSTDAGTAVGSCPDFVNALLSSPDAGAGARLCQWNGATYLAGVAPSKGYREFKISDGYRDDVRSVLLSPVDRSPAAGATYSLPGARADVRAGSRHYGVVQCGRMLFGLASAQVVEAVAATQMAAAPVHSTAAGMLEFTLSGVRSILPVYDACLLSGQAPVADPRSAVAIIVRCGGQHLGLLVERLIDVIACDSIALPPGGINPDAPWINGYIHDGRPDNAPVFTLDPDGLLYLTEAAVPA